MKDALSHRLDAAEALARDAGALALEIAGSGRLEPRQKRTALDLVTRADDEAERFLRQRLTELFPDDAVLGEEHGWSADENAAFRWAIDPVDGTANFVLGIPHWCVSVGCLEGDRSVVGAIHDPNRGETFVAADTMGARLNGAPLPLPAAVELSTSTWATGLAEDLSVSRRDAWDRTVRPRIGRVRAMGSLALDLAWTAAGRCDAFFYECGLELWDFGAGEVICREAGLDVVRVPAAPPLSAAILVVPPRWRASACEMLGIGEPATTAER